MKKLIKNIFNKKDMNITSDDYFLDVHRHYDKNDFILWWGRLIDTNRELWNDALRMSSGGKKVLIATLGGGFSHRPLMTIDNLLNISLTLRGAQVETLLCDHALPACLKSEFAYIKPEVIYHEKISQTLCKGCYKDNSSISLMLGLVSHNMSTYVSSVERKTAREISSSIHVSLIKDFKINDVCIGKYAMAGCIRYFAHSNPLQMPLGEGVLRRYLEASIITYYSVKKLLENNKYDSVCLTHGTFTPHGVVRETCERFGIPVICWGVAYMKKRFIFTFGDNCPAMLREPNSEWENIEWGDREKKTILEYLDSRWGGSKDWVRIPKSEKKITFIEFMKNNNIDSNKPIIGLLTNVVWESSAEYESRAFPDMLIWLQKTIQYFLRRKDLQLVIRIHPAEITGNISKQLAVDEIRKMFKVLPDNVFIIKPEDNIDTYEAMEFCDSVLVYQTQAGHELAMRGIPVIVAAEAWIRGKGVVVEPLSEDEYFNHLDQLPLKNRLSEETIDRARKYAYHAFYRKMIPLSFLKETNDWMLYAPTLVKLDDLMPNKDKGLDIICDGILNHTPFTYPAEQLEGRANNLWD